ncbi:hypothetical protein [Catellatospora sp. NPDC049609]|uniref:hypothetical protein n=1 Tax=Catellatospora sp. NPDC049609 TaxID=3155505 RepID=UPI00342BCDF6
MSTGRRIPSLLASMLVCGALALTACGGGADPAPPAATGGSAAAVPPDDCAGAGERVRDHLKSAQVRSVAVQGQCTSVVVATSLGDGDSAAAQRLCDTAAEVAYSGDVNTVTVLAGSGAELAVGISGAKCLAG